MPNFPPPKKLAKKGYKVIYMTDKTDEDEVEQLKGCDDYKLRCCEKIGLQTDETQDAENKFEELKAEFGPLQKLIDEILHDRVDKLVLHQTYPTESQTLSAWGPPRTPASILPRNTS